MSASASTEAARMRSCVTGKNESDLRGSRSSDAQVVHARLAAIVMDDLSV
jgi:hypothetical protein